MKYIHDSEIKLIRDRKSVLKNNRGNLKKRLIIRLRKLKDKNLPSALLFLEESERKEIAQNIINSLDLISLKELINNYKDFINSFEKETKLSTHIQKTEGIRLNIRELKNIVKHSKNKKGVSKALNKIIHTDKFVLNRKLLRDKIYIQMTTKNIYHGKKTHLPIKIFNELKKKKQFRIKDIIKNGEMKREVIKKFYERGIVLPKEVTKKEFIERCRKQILKVKHTKNTYFPKDIFPFKYKKSSENEIVRLNPYYKHFKFQASS